ncbi:MAG: hypothetical protein ACLTEM_00415 [Segatella copri]
MTANERFEKAWGSFLVYLNRNPKAQLTPFLKERHVNHRTMMNWMCEKGYSVLRAKKGNPPSPGGSPQRKSRSICIKYRHDVRAYGTSYHRSAYGRPPLWHKHNLSKWNFGFR